MTEILLEEDLHDPAVFRPILAIGHTKNLIDSETVGSFLDYSKNRELK